MLVEKAVSFALGALAIVSIQAINGWWLNSGRGVGITVLVLSALRFLIACWRSGSARARAIALWAGAFTASTVILFRIGPGNIFPIVLAFAAIISALAISAGAAIGFVVTRRMKRN